MFTVMSDVSPTDGGAPSVTIELVLPARERDLGGFTVRRTLPAIGRRMVGPFIFFDHMGPLSLPPGAGMDVRPHPHNGLATVTFLFDGEIVHRDSLGSLQPIRPGDVNWMLAGRGIVHSERSDPQSRARGVHAHGIQSWMALPTGDEESAPRFEHHDAAALPRVRSAGAILDVIAGTAFGARSPTTVLSPTLYVHARLEAGAPLTVDAEHAERAVYVVEGIITCDGRPFGAGTMAILRPGVAAVVTAVASARLMLIGGAPLDGPRYIDWNFVSSDKERLRRAKLAWRDDDVTQFPKVPGDEHERIPVPAF
jgi:redox-sensitive bicupin YhaK (pirin superfamily)